ncbi:MAG: hypothetical protein ACFFBH_04415 [Promethearchaeota archaeon]
MKILSRRGKKFLYMFLFFTLVGISTLVYNSQNLVIFDNENLNLHSSDIVTRTREWIKNADFSYPIEPWYSQASGDISDTAVGFSPGEGYFKVIGEEYTFSDISGTPLSSNWTRVHNPEFPAYPDTATINSGGCYVSHQWAEYADQSPSVNWDRNVSMPIDMSDYIITSASLTAIVNGSVDVNVEAPGDSATDHYTWDYARFYVLLSDLSKSKKYEIAHYQTVDLGKDGPPAITQLNDTLMTTVSENDLKFYLTSVLSSDFQNFTITLGIRIWCEDNRLSDQDDWNYLYINSCSLTFTYQKKVDQRSSASWNQIGDRISGQNVSIVDGNLQFKYKIDQLWPMELSTNSRLNILINNNTLLENIKLITATSTFQDAKAGGFDVTRLILKDVNISLSIELFLGDTFPLDHNFTISITDVYLRIIYTEFVPEREEQPWFFAGLFIISAIAAAVLTGLLIAYAKVWRFPIPIRKIRKHKKALTDEKAPDVKIISREAAFKRNYSGEMDKTTKILKGPPLNGKIEKEKLFRK